MSNLLYSMFGNNRQPTRNTMFDIIQQFQNFRQQMQGKNPTEEINKLLQSGSISQQQLNQAQQMAQQMQSIFKNIK